MRKFNQVLRYPAQDDVTTGGGTAVAEAPRKATKKNTLTAHEKEILRRMEDTLRDHFESFSKAGDALIEIRDSRLYRETHGTFDDYCRERWDMSKTQANRLISAASVIHNIEKVKESKDIAEHLTESAVRPLTGLTPSQQQKVIRKVVEKAPPPVAGRSRVTARLVQNVARSTFPKAFKVAKSDGARRPATGDLVRKSEILGAIRTWEQTTKNIAAMSARDALKAVRNIIKGL
jgi:DNA replication initiation complex subunit (GINS family)